MSTKNTQNCGTVFQPVVLGVLSSLSFLRLLGIGFPTSPPDWQAVYLFLFPGSPVTNFLVERPLLIFLGVVFALAAKSAYQKRRHAFTNLYTEFTLDFITADGKRARLNVDQKVRANHPNISAYYATRYAGKYGTVPKDEITGWVKTHKNDRLESRLEVLGDNKNCEIIQICEPSFPFSTMWDLLPDFIRWDFLHRHIETMHYDCFNNQEDFHEVFTPRYPNRLITLKVCFHSGHAPTTVHGQRIMFNGIEEVEAYRVAEGNKITYSVPFEDSIDERLRISWTT